MTRRRICVFTGSRAEYGLLYWLLHELRDADDVDLQILVSGSHLSHQFGETWRQIVADGFDIAAKAEIILDSDSGTAMAGSLGLGVIKCADILDRLHPDILLLLGDRYELLAAASAAMCLRIPIAHLHGGESTEGLIDESVRHAVTAMSHIHFPAAEPYARRIAQMGHDPRRIFNVGALSLDNLVRLELPTRDELEADLGLTLGEGTILATYHPVTLADQSPEQALSELLAALDDFPQCRVIFTKANADSGGRIINSVLEEWSRSRQDRVQVHTSLGLKRYVGVLKHVSVMVGNSSSGIIEAPAAGCAVVNIGDRQKGRLRAPGIIDCPEERGAISRALSHAMSPDFQELARQGISPYGNGDAARKIRDVLRTISLEHILEKSFVDLGD